MKKIALILFTIVVAVAIWHRHQPRVRLLDKRNARLEAVKAELTARIERAEAGKHSAEEKLANLSAIESEADAPGLESGSTGTLAAVAPVFNPPAPDPSRHGGWLQGAPFVYLPKEQLTNVSYRLLNGEMLTDEAAALFALSRNERAGVERAFGDLLAQFRRFEIDRMELTAPPQGWITAGNPNANPNSTLQFDSALTYHIPDLSADIEAARKNFAQRLQDAIGPYRADLVQAAADSYLRENLDDLGTGERVIGFVWQPERDGTASLWYGIADARHGEGSFQRVPDEVDPHSQIAYYANLFGVSLPSSTH